MRYEINTALSRLSPQSAAAVQWAPGSLAAPPVSPLFIFLHKANSHSPINVSASLQAFSSCACFFCPEMPEASSCSAQNSPDLLAAVSPGRSYLISFHKSLAPWLLAFLMSRFLLQLVGWLIVFFPQRTWFPPFFLA